jgi:hypothetical protein
LTLIGCTSNVKEAYGYPVVPCSCNNCEQRCAADYYVSSPSTLHGVDWALIGFFYLGLLVFSIIVLFVQWRVAKRRQKLQRVNSESESLMKEMEESSG